LAVVVAASVVTLLTQLLVTLAVQVVAVVAVVQNQVAPQLQGKDLLAEHLLLVILVEHPEAAAVVVPQLWVAMELLMLLLVMAVLVLLQVLQEHQQLELVVVLVVDTQIPQLVQLQ
jgi:hypothetical protein